MHWRLWTIILIRRFVSKGREYVLAGEFDRDRLFFAFLLLFFMTGLFFLFGQCSQHSTTHEAVG